MRHQSPGITATTYALLAGAALVSFLLPEQLTVPSARGQSGPAIIRVAAVVRDFLDTHPDFGSELAGNPGHVAGNVALALDGAGRPALARDAGVHQGGGTDDIDLIAHWTFDEGSGLVAGDALGLNDGALLDGPQWVAGTIGSGALRFDGVDDHVEVPSSPQMQVSCDITFAGWFKLDADFDPSSPTTLSTTS
jgi:hypothetical protein